MKDRIITFTLAALCASLFAGSGYYAGYKKGHQIRYVSGPPMFIPRQPNLEELAREQPLPLQANLLTVLGAHASGHDMELLEILGPYSEASFKRLTGTNWMREKPQPSLLVVSQLDDAFNRGVKDGAGCAMVLCIAEGYCKMSETEASGIITQAVEMMTRPYTNRNSSWIGR